MVVRVLLNTPPGGLVLHSMNDRRRFTKSLATLVLSARFAPWVDLSKPKRAEIITVTGAIAPRRLGVCLTHEHVMSTFGAEPSERAQYDQAALMNQVLPYLKQIKRLGCQTIVDCTTAYFGRDVGLLQRLSQQSGVQIITNTGYYGAADDRYVPDHAHRESAETIAQRWITEFREGIDGTDIRPGFIKIALDSGPVSAIDAKLVRAAALTHAATGLTIACHTGDNSEGAHRALTILQEEGVSPEAWIWTHANKVATIDAIVPAAQSGAWISLDGVQASPKNDAYAEESAIDRHIRYLKAMKQRGFLSQVLLSHDGNSFPRGGPIRPYDAIFTTLLPRLEKEGFTSSDVQQLLVDHPARAFVVRRKII